MSSALESIYDVGLEEAGEGFEEAWRGLAHPLSGLGALNVPLGVLRLIGAPVP
jgi:hypothetical protein